MTFIPSFSNGQVVSNDELRSEFVCGNMGGMRRSKTTNTLVLVTDHTKGLYDDVWDGDVLLYTGMGKIGNQGLNTDQNKTLNESNSSGIAVYLFEVFERGKYTFHGQVKLDAAPYPSRQPGDDGVDREVWIFPLRLIDGANTPSSTLKQFYCKEEEKARKLSDADLLTRATVRQRRTPACRTVAKAKMFIRDPYVAELCKRRANGVCDLCCAAAPFQTKDGEWFLESHHVVWLSRGGADMVDNTCALCPNCHRKLHVLDAAEDVLILQNRLANRT